MTLAASTGLVSGINYSNLISQLIQADSTPITLIQSEEQTVNTQQSTLQSVSTALSTFEADVTALSTPSTFLSMGATTSDSSVLAATATNSAAAGTYNVQVMQTAQAQTIASQGVANTSTSIASSAGTFQFKVGGGSTTSVAVTAGMTLQQLNDAINSSGAPVSASIIDNGSAVNPYQLVLTANNSGAANTIQIANNGTSLNLSTPSIGTASAQSGNAFNGTVTASGTYTGTTAQNIEMQITTPGDVGTAQYKVSYDGGVTWSSNTFTTSTSPVDVTGSSAQGVDVAFADSSTNPTNFAVGDTFSVNTYVPQLTKAQDAVIQVNGIQISRPTNTISDVINGVTLTANQASSTPQTVTVNNSNVATQISSFVTDYNALVKEISTDTSYDTSSGTAAPLFGNAGVTGILSQLSNTIDQVMPGNSTYNSLASIGITVGSDGSLSVDQSTLNTALSSNLSQVQNLFTGAATGSNSAIQYAGSTASTVAGNYNVDITTPATQASVVGGQALASTGLAANETLTIAYNSQATNVNLTAGQNLASVISTLNSSFTANNMALQASNDNGELQISSTNYGSGQTVTVFSNQAANAAGQLGIGTSALTSTGVDVAGTIGGMAATGSGQTLTGLTGTNVAGLQLNVTATGPTSGAINLTQGIATIAQQQINAMTDPTSGIFASENATYTAQLTSYNNQITALQTQLSQEQTSLQSQFENLETTLANLQSQGNFLMSQLNSMNGTTSSSSSSTSSPSLIGSLSSLGGSSSSSSSTSSSASS